MNDTNASPGMPNEGPLSPAGVKALKFAVVAMGVLIVIGLIAVVGRVIYMASASRAAKTQPTSAIVERAKLVLPRATQAKSISLHGDRLSVHYSGSDQAGIVIMDLGSGRVLSRITLEASGANDQTK